jgi:ubiquinone/menaquinone biosynthesis C-methylase UbiE
MTAILGLVALIGCGGAVGGEPASEEGTYLGRRIARTMGVGGAPWLVRPERVVEEDPAALHAQLGLEPGDTVCDVGAGNGYHSLPLAKRVAPGGRVVATDIQQGMLDRLEARAKEAGIENVTTVLSTQTDAKLPEGTCDLVLFVDVYHELSDPEAMLADVRRSLTPDGRVALVEYRAEDPLVPMKPLHKMSVEQCDREYAANGFRRVGRYDGLPWQHLLFYASE